MINSCFRSAIDPSDQPKNGDIFQRVEIYKTSSSGIYVKLNSNARGFCSGNHLRDGNNILKHISRDYPVGKMVTCRVVKYNHMDQLFIVSLQKSDLEEQVSIRNLCVLLFRIIVSVGHPFWKIL